jgi:hypothetical protein
MVEKATLTIRYSGHHWQMGKWSFILWDGIVCWLSVHLVCGIHLIEVIDKEIHFLYSGKSIKNPWVYVSSTDKYSKANLVCVT